jgi:hypothetical protein
MPLSGVSVPQKSGSAVAVSLLPTTARSARSARTGCPPTPSAGRSVLDEEPHLLHERRRLSGGALAKFAVTVEPPAPPRLPLPPAPKNLTPPAAVSASGDPENAPPGMYACRWLTKFGANALSRSARPCWNV